ncbi:MAG: hypothetical protein JW744_00705 [Candidatus Diapherotrites archaeon]|uniref:Uncharacterized protein n=1 Tax=Candidatus Iainarchaeum sp. TaxID=3101447 RepID=A0A938YQF9_9ARCH|nr:hypothetical protein [Candidatus Diapherotrites archaeon]
MTRALMAVLGVGKGTWGHIARLISEEEWDAILLVGNDWGKENFSPSKEVDWIIVNNRAGFNILKDTIKEKLPAVDEICISLVSGSGKEHMALLAALREAGKEFKMVILTGEGTKYY